jgi:aconitate hydratase
VFLKDIWPTQAEVNAVLGAAADPVAYRQVYGDLNAAAGSHWQGIQASSGHVYKWDPEATYIRHPPYFEGFSTSPARPAPIRGARALAVFGDSITTDHISPAGSIKPSSPAGKYLQSQNVKVDDFNSYGARRGNHEVMVRGTFANVRIKNLMLGGAEGGNTIHQPSGERLSIYDAALRYQAEGTPLIIFTGHEYGTGSSRDWAAKGTRLLGVRAVVARSFERIHRSNLVGMGVLPCQFPDGVTAETLRLDGTEVFDLEGIEQVRPRADVTLVIHRKDGTVDRAPLVVRIDTPIEVEYYEGGGILPYVLRQLISA